MKNTYPIPPSHRTFTFGKVIINSNFDGGNCSGAEKISQSTVRLVITQYAIWIGADHPKNPYRMWFHFSIEGISKNSLLTFQIKNMQNQVNQVLSSRNYCMMDWCQCLGMVAIVSGEGFLIN